MSQPFKVMRGVPLLACLVLTSCGKTDATGSLAAAKYATWNTVSVEFDGQTKPEGFASKMEFRFVQPKQFTLIADGVQHKGVFVLTDKMPKRIELRPDEANTSDKPLYGIYALERDQEEMICAFSATHYPSEFKSRRGTDIVVMKLKPAKD